jgi:hypothetical protein
MRKQRTWTKAALALVAAAALQSTGCAALLVGGAIGGASAGAAASAGEPGHKPLSYVGSVLASAVYFPAKVLFAAGGAVTSGVAYVATLGSPEPSHDIWDASVEGDYVVTPSMIEGREDVDFVGS